MELRQAAKICHQANKALCEEQGDNSQLDWDQSEGWQRDSAEKGVRFALDNPNATPEDQHQSWCDQKVADGWTYGTEKNPEAKTHPCLVPYNQLPIEQQSKDHLFRGIVSSLRPFIKQ